MKWENAEIREALRMVESEHLDIRTVTMAVNLLDAATDSIEGTCDRIEKKLEDAAGRLVPIVEELQGELGVPIVNKRLAVTPVSLIGAGTGADSYVEIAQTLDRVAESVGVDYVGGFSALVEKGFTRSDRVLLDSIPEALNLTKRLCSSVNVATTKSGINMDAVRIMGGIIKDVAELTADRDAIGCAKLVVFANAVGDNPFIAGAFHGIGEPECAINVGVSGPGVVAAALERLQVTEPGADFGRISEVIKNMAFKVTRVGEMVGREVVRRLGNSALFGIVDLSLAPTPAIGDSVARILELLGLQRAGAHGSTAALALLTDAVKKGGVMASAYVGGLSGAFIPVSEDQGMIDAAAEGALSLAKLEAMTAICSVGLDMVAIPGDTSAEVISAIIADEAAIGVMKPKLPQCA